MSIRFGQHRYVSIKGCVDLEQPLQIYLARCVIQQIGSPHYVRYVLCSIIDHHRQHIGEQPIAAPYDDVAYGGCDVLPEPALNSIRELYIARVDAQSGGGEAAGLVNLWRAGATRRT